MTISLSINGCSQSNKHIRREKTRLTSTEVWAATTSKDWRDSFRASFPLSYSRRQNEALLAGWAFFWVKVPQVPGTAGSAVTFGLSINGCSHSKKPVWREKTRLTSTEVWAAATSKDWRDSFRASFPPSYLRRQNEALLAGWAFFWVKVPQVPGTAGSAVTFGLSINGCSHSKKPVWHEKTRLTSTEVWAATTSKDWRDSCRASFPLSYSRRQNDARHAGCHNVVPHGGGWGGLGLIFVGYVPLAS